MRLRLARIEGSYRIETVRYRPGAAQAAERSVYQHYVETGLDRWMVTERLRDGRDQRRAWISRGHSGAAGSECRYASYLGGLDFTGFPENDFFTFLLEHRADLQIRGIDQESRLVNAGFAYTAEEGRKTGSCTVWLDVGKDFMLRRRVWEAKYRANDCERQQYERFEVEDSQQFEGVWLPTRFTDVTLASGGSQAKPVGNLWETTAENIKVGRVRKEDLELVFPVGTSVHNEVTGDRWVVTAGSLDK